VPLIAIKNRLFGISLALGSLQPVSYKASIFWCFMNFRETAKKILPFLKNHPETRDDDLLLISETWKKDLGDISTMSALQLLDALLSKNIEHPESIRRTRQRLQEKNIDLRGNKWASRHGYCSEVCKQLTFFDIWGI
jgi:hypothetical protein